MPLHRALRRLGGALFAGSPLMVLLAFSLALARPAAGQPAPPSEVASLRQEIDALRSEYEQRIAALEAKLAALSTAAEQRAAMPPPAPPPPAPPPVTAAPAKSGNYFNPAISLIGNFLAVGGQGSHGDLPNASLRESEISLQAVVDPYARADLFLSFGEEGVEVEEGYVTFTALPAQLLAKVGRMRTSFGKVNTMHLHTLPWPDEPLPVVNLLGGEEGWIGTGVSLSRLLPVGDTFTELTFEVMRGDSPGLFQADKTSDLALNGHYRIFRDLTDASNLDIGLSYGFGPNGTAERADTALAGLDLTYRWKPLRTGSYRGLIVRGEAYRSERQQPGGRQDAFGWYLSGEYRLAKRWSLGARLEAAERAADASLRDTGQALSFTFDLSEFLRWRGELRRRRFAEDLTTNDFLMQLQFAVGAHGAHPF